MDLNLSLRPLNSLGIFKGPSVGFDALGVSLTSVYWVPVMFQTLLLAQQYSCVPLGQTGIQSWGGSVVAECASFGSISKSIPDVVLLAGALFTFILHSPQQACDSMLPTFAHLVPSTQYTLLLTGKLLLPTFRLSSGIIYSEPTVCLPVHAFSTLSSSCSVGSCLHECLFPVRQVVT